MDVKEEKEHEPHPQRYPTTLLYKKKLDGESSHFFLNKFLFHLKENVIITMDFCFCLVEQVSHPLVCCTHEICCRWKPFFTTVTTE